MADFVFFYVDGNLDNTLTDLTEWNDLYRIYGSDEKFGKCFHSLDQMEPRASEGIGRPARGLILDLEPSNNGHRSLVLKGRLRNLDGTVYRAYQSHRNNRTVRDAGRGLILKHGEFHVGELQARFNREFIGVLDKDYAAFEVAMLEFFLQNLPLLNAYDLTPVQH